MAKLDKAPVSKTGDSRFEPWLPRFFATSRVYGHPMGATAGNFWKLLVNSFKGLSAHNGTQLAAGMSYYALLAIFPAFLVAAAVAGLFLDDPEARQDVVDFLLDELPLTAAEGTADVEELVDGVVDNSGSLGLIGGITLLISASALMSAARTSIGVIYDEDCKRGALRGKGLDILLLLSVGGLLLLSFAATLVLGLDLGLGDNPVSSVIEDILDVAGSLIPLAITAAVFVVLYRILPTTRPPYRDIWPGVAFATISLEVLKRGFSFYLDNFASYGAVYGSLGAVIAFMFFAYLASIVFLLGAEMVVLWPKLKRGELDGQPDPRSFKEKLADTLKGLVERRPAD